MDAEQRTEGIEVLDVNEAGGLDLQGSENKERVTTRFMTKYERARVLGTRALQISMNAPVLVDTGKLTDPLQVGDQGKQRKKPLILKFAPHSFSSPLFGKLWTTSFLPQEEELTNPTLPVFVAHDRTGTLSADSYEGVGRREDSFCN